MGLLNRLESSGLQVVEGDFSIDGAVEMVKLDTAATLSAARTITMAEIKGGIVSLNLNGTDRTVTLPTSALVRAGLLNRSVGAGLTFVLRNTGTAGKITLAGGTNMTLSPTAVVIPPLSAAVITLYLTTSAVGSEAVTAYVVGQGQEHVAQYCAFAPAAGAANSCITSENAVTGVLTPDTAALPHARTLKITITDVNTSITAGTVTVVGVDQNGVTRTETFDATDIVTAAQDTTYAYKSVTSVTLAGIVGALAGTDTISVGFNDVFGLPSKPYGIITGVLSQNKIAAVETAGTEVVETPEALTSALAGTIAPATSSDGTLSAIWTYKYI